MKFIVNFITTPVSENKANWDNHLSTTFFSYKTIYKVATQYINQCTKYVMSTFSGDHKNVNLIKIFTNRLIDLEKLHINKL